VKVKTIPKTGCTGRTIDLIFGNKKPSAQCSRLGCFAWEPVTAIFSDVRLCDTPTLHETASGLKARPVGDNGLE
jgi:hypothetical protein